MRFDLNFTAIALAVLLAALTIIFLAATARIGVAGIGRAKGSTHVTGNVV